MTQRLRWAILGTGTVARRFAAALRNIADQADLVAVGSRQQATADAFGDQYGIRWRYASYEQVAANPDVDVVYIGTPHEYHRRDAAMCLELGKHVLCEKAFTVNAREAGELIHLARRRNLFLMEAMWTRFFPIHVHLRELLAEGVLGSLGGLTVHHNYTAGSDPPGTYERRLGMGTFLDQAPYGVGFGHSLLGPVEAVAGLATFSPQGANLQAAYILRHAADRLTTVINSRVTVDVKEAIVYGSRGKIHIHDPWYKPSTLTVFLEGQAPQRVHLPLNGFIGYEYEALAVTECLRQGQTECDVMPLDATLATLQVMDQIRQQWTL
jgi:predicted dehydrogenase